MGSLNEKIFYIIEMAYIIMTFYNSDQTVIAGTIYCLDILNKMFTVLLCG